jgi:hypothetical protein
LKKPGQCSSITYIVQERAFDFLDAPIQRITTATPAPYSPVLLKEWLPNADDVIKAVKKVMYIIQLTCYRSFIIHLFDAFVLNSTMKRIFYLLSYFLVLQFCFSQTKVSGMWIKQTSLFLCKHSFQRF